MENTTRLELWLVPLMIFTTSKNFVELCYTVIIDIIAVFFYAYYIFKMLEVQKKCWNVVIVTS